MDPMDELVQFLNIDSRFDLKCVAVEHVLGITGNSSAHEIVLANSELLNCLLNLVHDKECTIRRKAILSLINVSATENGVNAIIELKNDCNTLKIVDEMVRIVLDEQEKNADAACMLLCNLTRVEAHLERCLTIIYPQLGDILSSFINLSHNKVGETLHYLGPLWSNLSGSKRVRNWLCTGGPLAPLIKLCTFSGFESSSIRRGGAIGTIRNVCFEVDRQDWLLGPEVNILSYLLLPLIGGEDYPDDEMDALPIDLQFQPPEKQREQDPDIRILLLETLARFCVKKSGREILRNNGVYYILRELHKWEKDKKALLACENVVDILIRKEEEMGAEDLTSIEVPPEYHEKFKKMDDDFINDE